MTAASRLGNFHALHPVSAKTGDGMDDLRGARRASARGAAPFHRRSSGADLSVEEQISELIREKALWLA